jgi:hypothetical protein
MAGPPASVDEEAGRDTAAGWRRWSGPIWPLAVVVSLLTVEVRFLAHSSWRPVMLYNGDSLTLPILWRALIHGEPLHPVLSPQLLLFPEAVIYAVARLGTTSTSASLVAVAYINVVLFYLGLRALAAVVVAGSADRRRLAAVVPTLLLIASMLLERVMGLNQTTIATPFLFDSFYAGVILVGLAALGFAVRQLDLGVDRSRRRRLITSAGATAILALAIISDPLFVVQVSAPFLLVVAVLFALGRLGASTAVRLAGPHAGAIVAYAALAPLYRRYLGEDGSGYVHVNQIGAASRTLERDLGLILHSAAGRVEVALLALAWLVGLLTLAAERYRTGAEARLPAGPTGPVLVSAFAIVASVSILPAVILVGEGIPRYLLPMVTFPFVALVPAANLRRPGPIPAFLVFAARRGPVIALTAVTVLGVTALPGAAALVGSAPAPVNARYGTPAGESCLEAAFGGRPVSGVASYWTARALDVANTDGQRILQVKTDLTIFPWLVNLGAYEHRRFRFVLIDGSAHAQLTMRPGDVMALGPPARLIACPGFTIYSYPPGTVGYDRLNTIVDRSLQADLKQFG